jgi:hypothetical protein
MLLRRTESEKSLIASRHEVPKAAALSSKYQRTPPATRPAAIRATAAANQPHWASARVLAAAEKSNLARTRASKARVTRALNERDPMNHLRWSDTRVPMLVEAAAREFLGLDWLDAY